MLFAEVLGVKRLFIRNLLLLQGLNLLIKPVWLLVVDRMVQNHLGTHVYGKYYIVLNLTLVLNIFLDLGIQNFNNTSVAADARFFRKNFGSILLIKSLLSSLYLTAVLLIGLRSGMESGLLLVLISNQILVTFILYLRTNINGLHDYRTDSLLSVSDKFFSIAFCLFLYYTSRLNIMSFALAQLVASGLTFTLALSINLMKWKAIPSAASDLKHTLPDLVRQSLPFALLFTLMNFYTRMDVTMMHYLIPDAEYHSGIYAQSFRLLDAAAMFAMLFASLLLPMFARMISERGDVRPLSELAATLLLIVSLTAATASVLYSDRLLAGLYTFQSIDQLNDSSAVFKNIMLTFVPMSLTFVFSTLLTAKKDIWHMNIYAAAAFICNFTINLILIPELKSFGASVSSLITQSLFAVLCLSRCFRLFDFRIHYKLLTRFFIFVLMQAGLYILLKPAGNIWLEMAAFAFVSAILTIPLKIIELRSIRALFAGKVQ